MNTGDLWPFDDPPNVITFTVRQVMEKVLPILYVRHDESDGGWQFLTGESVSMKDAMLVGLKEVCKVDDGVLVLADLPLGWAAKRDQVGAPWVRF
jgi:hypothetical protein